MKPFDMQQLFKTPEIQAFSFSGFLSVNSAALGNILECAHFSIFRDGSLSFIYQVLLSFFVIFLLA